MVERVLEVLPRAYLERTAAIIGPSSAAAKAIADFDRRVTEGEDPEFYWSRTEEMLLVGPRFTPPDQGRP
jgi:hypothetical protein